jgi:hypothetical protein
VYSLYHLKVFCQNKHLSYAAAESIPACKELQITLPFGSSYLSSSSELPYTYVIRHYAMRW